MTKVVKCEKCGNLNTYNIERDCVVENDVIKKAEAACQKCGETVSFGSAENFV